MSTFRIVVLGLVSVSLLGCGSVEKSQSELYSWKNMTPPRSSVLGREVMAGGFIGEQVFNASGDAIEEMESIGYVKQEQYDQLAAGAELTMKKITAEMGAGYEKAQIYSADSWIIKGLKKITHSIDVNRRFVYQCIAAKSSVFRIQKKFDAGLNLDATKSEIATTLGIEEAKISIGAKSEKPDLFEVKIENPNVCFSYKSAIFEDDGFYFLGMRNIGNNYVTITGNGSASLARFNLADGQVSNFRTAQFIGDEPLHKPMYRLLAKRDNTNKLTLSVCRQGQGITGFDYVCKVIDHDGTGKWDRPYHIDTFSYVNGKYKVVLLSITAQLRDDEIVITSASLRYPQYALKLI